MASQFGSWDLDRLLAADLKALNTAFGGTSRLDRLADHVFRHIPWARIAADVLALGQMPAKLALLLERHRLVHRFGVAMQGIVDADTAMLACRLVPASYKDQMRKFVYAQFVRGRLDVLIQTFTPGAYEQLQLGPRQHVDTLCQNYVDTIFCRPRLDPRDIDNLTVKMNEWRDACPIPDMGVRVSEMAVEKLAVAFPADFARKLRQDVSLARYVQDEPGPLMHVLVARAKYDMAIESKLQRTLTACRLFRTLDPFVHTVCASTRVLAGNMVTVRLIGYMPSWWPRLITSDIEPCVLDAAEYAIRSLPADGPARKLVGLCPIGTTADVIFNGCDVCVPMNLVSLLARVADRDRTVRNHPYYRQLVSTGLVDAQGRPGTEFKSTISYMSPAKLAAL